MMDPRLSQGFAVLTSGALAVISWTSVYQPAVRVYRHDQQQVEALGAQLSQVEAMVRTAGGMDTWYAHNQKRLEVLKQRFPAQTQLPQLLNALVDIVKMGDVKLLDVSQGNVEPVQDAEQPVLVENQPCYRLPVTLTVEGRYHAVVQALERMTAETFPSVVSFEHVDLQLKDPQGAVLAATVKLYLYVVGAPWSPPGEPGVLLPSSFDSLRSLRTTPRYVGGDIPSDGERGRKPSRTRVEGSEPAPDA